MCPIEPLRCCFLSLGADMQRHDSSCYILLGGVAVVVLCCGDGDCIDAQEYGGGKILYLPN